MTKEEIAKAEQSGNVPWNYFIQGWHFCEEWDGLLIGPGYREMEVCSCSVALTELAGNQPSESVTE